MSDFKAFSWRVKQVLACIWLMGAVTGLVAIFGPLVKGGQLSFQLPILLLIAFTTVADLFPVTFAQRYEITVSNVFLIGAIMIYKDQPGQAAVVAIVSTAIWQLINRRPWYKLLTNVALPTTAVVSAGTILAAIGWDNPLHIVLATGAMLVVYFIADTVPLSMLLAALEERPFEVAYITNYSGVVLELIGIEFFGLIFFVAWRESLWLSFLFVIPTVILRQAYFQVERLRNDSLRALSAITDVIESRDELTHHHTQAVSTYARRVAERMKLSADEIWQVSVAGQLHDLGKIAVRDSILFKPGKLTEAEMDLMRKHCAVGHEIVRQFSNLEKVAALVRAHHERYDGKGYPDGVGGNELPIGAAIVAVADAFDAMRTDRPYRKALPLEKAIETLKQGLGTQWHPIVGATFIQLMLEDAANARADATLVKLPDVAA